MIDWTVITVTFNSREALTDHWVEQIPANVRWIVVDNASTDDTKEVAEALGAEVVPLPKNLGFSRGNNTGSAIATSEYVAFVNPDVTIDWTSLRGLASDIDRFGALVSPALRNPDGTAQQNARGIPYFLDKLGHRGVRLPFQNIDRYLPELQEDITPVAWVMGAALCGRRRTLEELGGWDEAFFIYYEDHEIGLRAWSRGVPVLVDDRARWVHGWARATKGWNTGAWSHEIKSAATFYTRYPELVLPLRKLAATKSYTRGMSAWRTTRA